jgi:hypothetical protein
MTQRKKTTAKRALLLSRMVENRNCRKLAKQYRELAAHLQLLDKQGLK